MSQNQRIEVIAGHLAASLTSTGSSASPVVSHSVLRAAQTSGGKRRVCVVLGAGGGIGVNVGKKFAREGMVVCLCRRSGKEGLDQAVKEINAAGGEAHGFLINAIEPNVIEDTINQIENQIGEIHCFVYNLGAQIGGRSLEATTLKTFEQGWRLGCEGLFRAMKVLAPHMLARGEGTVLCTSATSSMRGNQGQHSHAASVGGRRLLLQSLMDELGPKGLHFCHIIVDAAVDAPDTIGKLMGKDNFEKMVQAKGDGIVKPEHLAETYYHLYTQHRSVWTFELDVRPYNCVAWWNS